MTWQLFAATILSFIFQRPTYWKKLELSDRPGTIVPFTFSINFLWERPRSSNVSTLLWFYFPKLKQLQWLMQAWSFVMGHLWDLNCHSVRCERWGEGNVDPFLPSHYWNPPTLIFISTGKCCAPPTGLVMILGHRDTSQIMCTLVSGLGGKITIYKPKLLFLLLWTWAV